MATWRPEWLAFVPTFAIPFPPRETCQGEKGKRFRQEIVCLSTLDSTSTRRTTHSFPRMIFDWQVEREQEKSEKWVRPSVCLFPLSSHFTLSCYRSPSVISRVRSSSQVSLSLAHHRHDQSRWHLLICFSTLPVLWVVSSLRLWFLLSCSRYFYLFTFPHFYYPSRFMLSPKRSLLRAQRTMEGKVTLVELLTGHTLFCVLLNYSRR